MINKIVLIDLDGKNRMRNEAEEEMYVGTQTTDAANLKQKLLHCWVANVSQLSTRGKMF